MAPIFNDSVRLFHRAMWSLITDDLLFSRQPKSESKTSSKSKTKSKTKPKSKGNKIKVGTIQVENWKFVLIVIGSIVALCLLAWLTWWLWKKRRAKSVKEEDEDKEMLQPGINGPSEDDSDRAVWDTRSSEDVEVGGYQSIRRGL
ncbi:hypothetical protein CC80DRAFT_555501 [Byssothecium circinans]|uniref:Uncharacterized protein n=1 Tax=Byssothecium circinans TaxID=147558 RepID=A0A6A5TAW5_9PLEO|nr:hypothetical protein CC80DRAFT_555501 [Byssothecium circinans]